MSWALTRQHEPMNVERPTSNVQRRTNPSSLDVERWLFDVRHLQWGNPGAQTSVCAPGWRFRVLK